MAVAVVFVLFWLALSLLGYFAVRGARYASRVEERERAATELASRGLTHTAVADESGAAEAVSDREVGVNEYHFSIFI